MIPTVSICIPTLNRPELLLQSLNSILRESALLDKLEICISNNCSEVNYSAVDVLVADYSDVCSIKYKRHEDRLSLDENHHYVKGMATSEYIYFLGDDDFFLRDELSKLLDLIKRREPDLAIFNGYQVDINNEYLGQHFSLIPCEYSSIEVAFRALKDKGSFGSVLVRRDMLQDEDFAQLYGTDHAYGCYWLSIFRKYQVGEKLKIIVADFPCVALRAARKTYNHIDVYFNKIPLWMARHHRILQKNEMLYLINESVVETAEFNTSLRFLMHLRGAGYDLRSIKKADPDFYDQHQFRIWCAQNFAASFFYKGLRRLYRSLVKTVTPLDAQASKEHIAYKLSSAVPNTSN